MKKNLFALMFTPLLLISCVDDDTTTVPQSEPFFNLVVGNEWVYKKYMVPENGTEHYDGVDTVTVTGQEVINGNTYYTIEHSDNSMLFSGFVETSRVNNEGHLVNIYGRVLHPGFDSDYQITTPFVLSGEQIGILDFTSQSASSILVEGNTYNVIPFAGNFTNTIGAPEGEGVKYDYQQGIGLVKAKCRLLSDLSYIEYRLVSYDLN